MTTKIAFNLSGVGEHAAGAAVGTAATLGAGALLHSGYKGYKALAEPMLRARRYKALQEEYPDLEDTPTARRAFRTLHKFSPDMASDPMAAHGFVNRVMNYNELTTPEQISTLVGVQRGMPQSPQMLDQAAQGFGRDLSQRMMAAPEEARREHKHQFEYGIRGTAAKEEKRRAAKEKRDITDDKRRQVKHDFEYGVPGEDGEAHSEAARRQEAHGFAKAKSKFDRWRGLSERRKDVRQKGMDERREAREIRMMGADLRDQRRQMEEGKKRIEQGRKGFNVKRVDVGLNIYKARDTLMKNEEARLFATTPPDSYRDVYDKTTGQMRQEPAHSDTLQEEMRRDALDHATTVLEKFVPNLPGELRKTAASQLNEMRASRSRSSAKADFAERFKR